ncbi:MAG TPA: TRAP transporter small permease subunit [Rhodospirillales bacterium]|nr:TRAP transporter small permease subunit [Rhodospirillales bacterium]
MVLMQFTVVVMRYIFGLGSIMMQESVVYLHGALFMLGAGYTLLHEGHVRVDIFYREASPRKKAMVDLFGSLLLLMPVCILITWYSFPYLKTSWSVLEGSRETSGIQGVYLLKSTLWAFTGLMMLQGLSIAAKSFLFLIDDKGQD